MRNSLLVRGGGEDRRWVFLEERLVPTAVGIHDQRHRSVNKFLKSAVAHGCTRSPSVQEIGFRAFSWIGVIQAFVPKVKLTQYMGGPDAKSISLSTLFGAASSSCSFAALAAARSLVAKGAHFVTAVAFMFASTDLVIELGILILIFLGPQYLAAEIVGGLVLIAISSLLIRWTYPDAMLEAAREKVEREAPDMERTSTGKSASVAAWAGIAWALPLSRSGRWCGKKS